MCLAPSRPSVDTALLDRRDPGHGSCGRLRTPSSILNVLLGGSLVLLLVWQRSKIATVDEDGSLLAQLEPIKLHTYQVRHADVHLDLQRKPNEVVSMICGALATVERARTGPIWVLCGGERAGGLKWRFPKPAQEYKRIQTFKTIREGTGLGLDVQQILATHPGSKPRMKENDDVQIVLTDGACGGI